MRFPLYQFLHLCIFTIHINHHMQVRKQTRFPKWNAVTTLPIPAISKECVVHLELWDRDLLGKDEFMGQVRIGSFTFLKILHQHSLDTTNEFSKYPNCVCTWYA